ncbi:tmcB-like protein [Carpediemonas membranifera]|uniref:TmcB-like protein n=1 Tax=Carpediemonas membranifera TaxID=201153 RepID=A0A8J6E053_9EUKA|nr:tmcB-like protein [Carpediemonas membranifera]|eukprot:KAG9394584.1 tmcB-like protein [Carpediemonas membranifera]
MESNASGSTRAGRNSSVFGSDSVASSSTAQNATESIRSVLFELIYLTSSPSRIFWILSIIFMVVDFIQLFSFAVDTSIQDWGVLAPLQDALALSRVTTLADYTNKDILLGLGVFLLAFLVFFAGTCFLSARAIQNSQVPNMMLVRFIRLSLILMTTMGFIPVFSVLVSLAAEYVPTSLDGTSIAIFTVSVALAVAITAAVALITLTSCPFGFTSPNPLTRLHSRVDVVYLLGKAITVVLYKVPFLTDHSVALVVWMVVFTTATVLLYSLFVPYYSLVTNCTRVLLSACLFAGLAIAVHPLVGLLVLLLSPLVIALPIGTVLLTDFCLRKFRMTAADIAKEATMPVRPLLLFPFQVEIALRKSRLSIKRQQHTMQKIVKSVPIAMQEYGGGQSEAGVVGRGALSEAQVCVMVEADKTIEREIDFSMRLFQCVRARWPKSPFVAITYICFSAAYRSESLQSVIYSTGKALSSYIPIITVDVSYFQFICTKYRSALYEDSSVITKLEAQRNMASLSKAQRQLTDTLSQFWSQVGAVRGHRLNLSQFKSLSSTTSRIARLQTSTEKLYQRMLAHPTPRVLRSYAQYVSLFNSSVSAKNFCDELYGMADELEVVPGGTDRDTNKHGMRVGRMNLRGSSDSFAWLHFRAVFSTVLIMSLFAFSVGACIYILKLYEHITAQTVGVISVATGMQHIALGLMTARNGLDHVIVSGTQYAGPGWSAIVQDMSKAYIDKTALLYFDAVQIYVSGDILTPRDPYATLDEVDRNYFNQAVDSVISVTTHLLYNLPDLIRAQTMEAPVYQSGAIHHTERVSMMEYVSECIHAAETVSSCLINSRAAGNSVADGLTACTAGKTDQLQGYEAALVAEVLPALDAVADRVFVISQLFPLIELILILVIFIIFIASVFFVALTLYLMPISQDISFTVHILQMFSAVPGKTLESIMDRFHAYKSTRMKSMEDVNAHSMQELLPLSVTPSSEFLQSNRNHFAQFPRTEVISNRASRRSVDFQQTDEDPDDGNIETSDRSAVVVKESSSSSDTDESTGTGPSLNRPDTVPADNIIFSAVMTIPETVEEPEEDNLQDANQLQLDMADKPVDEAVMLVRAKTSTIRFRMAMRQMPSLCVWIAAFATLYVVMGSFSIYRTSDVSQTSATLFYQYRSAVMTRGGMVTAGSYSAGLGTTSPLNMTYCLDVLDKQLEAVKPFAAHLSGDKVQDQSIVVDAWKGVPSFLRTASNWFSDIVVQDNWVDGPFETEITDLLFTDDCIRISEDYCTASFDATRIAEARKGLINMVTSFIDFLKTYREVIASGSAGGATYYKMYFSVELDMTGSLIRLSFILRDRFSELLETTQSDVLYFLVAFLVIIVTFYGFYLFRTILQIARTRRHFGVLFKMLPRDQMPQKLTDEFLSIFPDDSL